VWRRRGRGKEVLVLLLLLLVLLLVLLLRVLVLLVGVVLVLAVGVIILRRRSIKKRIPSPTRRQRRRRRWRHIKCAHLAFTATTRAHLAIAIYRARELSIIRRISFRVWLALRITFVLAYTPTRTRTRTCTHTMRAGVVPSARERIVRVTQLALVLAPILSAALLVVIFTIPFMRLGLGSRRRRRYRCSGSTISPTCTRFGIRIVAAIVIILNVDVGIVPRTTNLQLNPLSTNPHPRPTPPPGYPMLHIKVVRLLGNHRSYSLRTIPALSKKRVN
jgi:Ca2+/Na+ antiporter